ncbi:tryptophan synthase subunit alpha [Nocardia sp. SYP-A9097]|uniref:tryptophan synthase subunit alpha n=1 Tax=Nocardia sp. SYP-A9097 TaxID=2663237 RepID=UPI001323878C|nr:tryptophan synthase subunit alpha [Nocardia sp. SYP-A9097]MRH88174.1 tryptophan synthase subunit alpha [Nocardia sp. SYP-A9097]
MNAQLLTDTLAKAASENRAALLGYMPAGFPTVDGGIAAMNTILDAGADVIEIGLPHSDPVLDGPVIQTADDIALRGGIRIKDVLRTVREVYRASGKPVLVMSYWNPIQRYGIERFTTKLAEAGGAGCILPDLPVQESAVWRAHADKRVLATVFVVAPSSTNQRLAEITTAASGFVYASAVMGVTGTGQSAGAAADTLVHRVKATTDLPVCVGIGISTPAQAATVAAFADGVIVGSALVKAILDAPDRDAGLAAVRELTAALAEAVRGR